MVEGQEDKAYVLTTKAYTYMVGLGGECCMLREMSVKKEVFQPIYRLFPGSLKEKFSSGEFDVKAQEALEVAKKAALEWFGDDQMFSL